MLGIEIVFKDEIIGLKYSIWALKIIFKKLDKLSVLEAETYSEVALAQIVYGGYVNHCVVKELTPKFSFEQIFEGILSAECKKEEIEKAINSFTEACKNLNETTDAASSEKKRLTGKKSKKRRTES